MTIQQLERELLKLSLEDQQKIARWLNETLEQNQTEKKSKQTNPLLKVAGKFSGGPGDSATQVEEILKNEVDSIHGLGKR